MVESSEGAALIPDDLTLEVKEIDIDFAKYVAVVMKWTDGNGKHRDAFVMGTQAARDLAYKLLDFANRLEWAPK